MNKDKQKPKDKEDDPVKRGQEAIRMQVKISGKSKKEAEEDQKKDAENWRNEG